jgi:hypothetical protein
MLDHTRAQYDWATATGEKIREFVELASAISFVALVLTYAALFGGVK